MADITNITGTRTTGLTLDGATDIDNDTFADGPLYIVSANFMTAGASLTVATGQTGIELVFTDGGSIFNGGSGLGNGISTESDLSLVVQQGSIIETAGLAIHMHSHMLDLLNFGTIQSDNGAGIAGAGAGSVVTNYGFIRGNDAYSASAAGASLINNYGHDRGHIRQRLARPQ